MVASVWRDLILDDTPSFPPPHSQARLRTLRRGELAMLHSTGPVPRKTPVPNRRLGASSTHVTHAHRNLTLNMMSVIFGNKRLPGSTSRWRNHSTHPFQGRGIFKIVPQVGRLRCRVGQPGAIIRKTFGLGKRKVPGIATTYVFQNGMKKCDRKCPLFNSLR